MQRRRHDLAAQSEKREQAMAIAEQRRFQRIRLEEQQHVANRESSRWHLDMEIRKEQLTDEQGHQARQEYELRARQLQDEDADRDLQAEAILKSALRNAEEGRWL